MLHHKFTENLPFASQIPSPVYQVFIHLWFYETGYTNTGNVIGLILPEVKHVTDQVTKIRLQPELFLVGHNRLEWS
jgi:hypothetical protein